MLDYATRVLMFGFNNTLFLSKPQARIYINIIWWKSKSLHESNPERQCLNPCLIRVYTVCQKGCFLNLNKIKKIFQMEMLVD